MQRNNNFLHLTMPIKSSEMLSEIYNHMSYADIILTCADSSTNQKPVAHKLVLSNCSPFLKTLLETNTDSHELIIPDVSTNTMMHILKLIYTGEVKVGSEDEISDVIEGIDLLGINSVVHEIGFSQEVEQTTSRSINEETAQLTPPPEIYEEEWTTSQLISPLSIEDHASYWSDMTTSEVVGVLPSDFVLENIKTEHVGLLSSSNDSHIRQDDDANETLVAKNTQKNKRRTQSFVFQNDDEDNDDQIHHVPKKLKTEDHEFSQWIGQLPVSGVNDFVFLCDDNDLEDVELNDAEKLLALQKSTMMDHPYAVRKQKCLKKKGSDHDKK
ncbi:uncharacterized protein LOC110859928 isoform X2 [Folsomia candida]|uniref:uncharacterized protein LOC110859928 isoform X2 n=1 Tax=Folsomia candida TaxID=158441 RepID=UPI000B8FAF65|nr:uncharacterized protein LOC110859928 isoform X2 [Folsomia candida]XP_035715751.1 uncharacterized protein LOC110859928 isoform X2 [Folsomia candida]XP_035715752.1 uncharacterized protein LOC110859928 isoform X2 [Folsomia candida]XP_035715753.1 uncharacterized protein LOC110859928 isoform X2 [Folsomia candida]XP_035715754.1 uncharacterized protein LOC110859928 isoform X2 [Folsomia candida]